MKITRFQVRAVSVPVAYPVISSVRETSNIEFVLLDVYTDEGITGISYAQAFNLYGCRAIRQCLEMLERTVVGRSVDELESIWQSMWNAIRLFGHQGLAAFALSMVDIALWDIRGKRSQSTVCQLLGGSHQALNAYCSDGIWLVSPLEAARQAERFAELGFTAMKMRLGRSEASEDLRAVKEVRMALGEQIGLMADVNQGWDVEHALRMGSGLEAYGLSWLEEPIEAEDVEGHVRLSTELSIPIATGENLYRLRSTRRFLHERAASVYTPDLQRIGGITGWTQLQPDFSSYGVAYSVHLFPEYAVHLLAAAGSDTRQGPALEWMSWSSALFSQPLVCKKGTVEVPDRPGFGMEWDEEKLTEWLVS
jgi:mandelate racemase